MSYFFRESTNGIFRQKPGCDIECFCWWEMGLGLSLHWKPVVNVSALNEEQRGALVRCSDALALIEEINQSQLVKLFCRGL
jgi:hypothetical protein